MTDSKIFILSVLDEGTPLILHKFGEDRVVELHELVEDGLVAIKDGGLIMHVNINDITVPDGIIEGSGEVIKRGLRKLQLAKLRETVKDREDARNATRKIYATV